MMFKRKRKEKPKRGNQLVQLIVLLVLLLLVAGGALSYFLFVPATVDGVNVELEPQPAMAVSGGAISMNGSGSIICSYSAGFGSRINAELAGAMQSALEAADIDISNVTVEQNLTQYRNCGEGEIIAEYESCSLLEIAMPINNSDPSEGELGREIATLFDVLTAENFCTPQEIRVIFETPNGSITWHMLYSVAYEAYMSGARNVELYDPSARR